MRTCTTLPLVGFMTNTRPSSALRKTWPDAKGCGGPLKTAPTAVGTGGIEHTPFVRLLQTLAPNQPANTDPAGGVDGVAVSVTPLGAAASEKAVLQPVAPARPFVIVQLMPLGVLVTVPLPLPKPTIDTPKVRTVDGTKLAPTVSDWVIVKSQKPVVSAVHVVASGAFATFQL